METKSLSKVVQNFKSLRMCHSRFEEMKMVMMDLFEEIEEAISEYSRQHNLKDEQHNELVSYWNSLKIELVSSIYLEDRFSLQLENLTAKVCKAFSVEDTLTTHLHAERHVYYDEKYKKKIIHKIHDN